MFNKLHLKQKPITVIEGLPHTQLDEEQTNDPLEELFN